jgi:hypothetical protein
MARLILGPVLRHVGETDATIWVETDQPCTVEVLGHRARTFRVAGHDYALVRIGGLARGSTQAYGVELDGEPAWPEPGSGYPPSVIRTLVADRPVRILFGSCRLARPHTPPYTLGPDRHVEGRGVDALVAFGEQLRHRPSVELPDLVLHLGDQVYSDQLPATVREFARGRRSLVPGPANEAVDFEEFARLYQEAWSEPTLRWLLSTVPNVMVFDDHDVHDDWNTSLAWRQQQERLPWWHKRLVAALMSYWLYQHVGNLDPAAAAQEGTLEQLERQRGDATEVLRAFAERACVDPETSRWSYRKDLGRTRLLVADSRAGRVLEPGRRDMLDTADWTWLEHQLVGGPEHLVVASTLPVLLPHCLHDLEAWNERVCDGAWGGFASGPGEWLRQLLDLEHWAAFESSFRHLLEVLLEAAAGSGGPRPATISLLGGDIHCGYVAEVDQPPGASPIHQLVSSPIRNRLGLSRQLMVRASLSGASRLLTGRLARSAGVAPPPVRWRITHGPWFQNHISELRLDGPHATAAVHQATPGRHPELRTRLLLRLDRPSYS